MSSKGHNKKRNCGLIYEFLVRLISSSLINEEAKAKIALGLIKKYFRRGTELYKEFRLINSLMKVSINNQHVAASILTEAKNAARQHDVTKLNEEKSRLIRDINHKLGGETFWDQPVSEYKMYATIQTLINDWREPSEATLQRQAEYEDRLVKWLTEAKTKPEIQEELAGSIGENRLVFKIMMNKIDQKYGSSLTPEQKRILREYVFTTISDKNPQSLVDSLTEVKTSVLEKLEQYAVREKDNKFMIDKISEVKNTIISESLENINDNTITRFMLYMKLASEFETKD